MPPGSGQAVPLSGWWTCGPSRHPTLTHSTAEAEADRVPVTTEHVLGAPCTLPVPPDRPDLSSPSSTVVTGAVESPTLKGGPSSGEALV